MVEISAREAEVLALLGEHLSNAEIGAKLYISARTVESHVSSLLRKLDVPDRRALAQRASERARAERSHPAPDLPTPLTSFIGRVRERAELTGMIKVHRQVTAVGPGGVGKTRLALAVAADAAGEYADGVWFVDLVPVADPGMYAVAAAVAGALGLGEQPGRGMDESVLAALADRDALLVLDNCEQVRDAVAPFLERLLTTCPRVTVLATSQARLLVPFERVYPVPPLSLDGGSDAVALFMDRAAADGRPPDPASRDRVASICARLDGMALAIELAAARYANLGLDGITAALSDPLRMLAGGSRADDRHRSVRAALDWSHALLEPADRALLRQVSVFMAAFTVEAAAQVAGEPGLVAHGLARLAEQSLLVVTSLRGGTAYRALETIRQYGKQRLTEAGELVDVRSRHLRWCLAEAAGLAVVGADWRARFDAVVDDLRAGLAWAASQPEQRPDAYRLARYLAELTFTRNLIGESQQRYEQAAALADDPATAASTLRHAAAVAGCRMRGDDMYRLHLAAADAARRAGDTAGTARELATAATNTYRFASKFARNLPPEEATALITEAQELAGDDPAARAAVALAEAGRALTDAFGAARGPHDTAVPETIACAERAVELADRTGDPLAGSAALDTLAAAQSWAGDSFAAAATVRRRIALLSPTPDTPASTHELIEALGEAIEASLGVGDMPGARRWARQLADHPLLVEVGHRATSWQLVTDALAGNVDEVLTVSVRFLDAWRQAGSPAGSVLGAAAAGVAMIHGLRDDRDAHGQWSAVLDQLDPSPWHRQGYGAVFDAMLMLHQGQARQALERMAPEPGEVWQWVTWIWLHWYVALRAEATVLAGHPNAHDRLAEARTIVAGNPVAGAIVERAHAVLDNDRDRLLATADTFDIAGCRYQSARTMVLAGGENTARGAALLADLGLTL
jgi:predicted ATPase/DNA-binding CsgD family transcriptional regulator